MPNIRRVQLHRMAAPGRGPPQRLDVCSEEARAGSAAPPRRTVIHVRDRAGALMVVRPLTMRCRARRCRFPGAAWDVEARGHPPGRRRRHRRAPPARRPSQPTEGAAQGRGRRPARSVALLSDGRNCTTPARRGRANAPRLGALQPTRRAGASKRPREQHDAKTATEAIAGERQTCHAVPDGGARQSTRSAVDSHDRERAERALTLASAACRNGRFCSPAPSSRASDSASHRLAVRRERASASRSGSLALVGHHLHAVISERRSAALHVVLVVRHESSLGRGRRPPDPVRAAPPPAADQVLPST